MQKGALPCGRAPDFCRKLLLSVLHSHSHGDGRANHGVVAHADQAHHLNVRRHGGGAGELGVGESISSFVLAFYYY